MSNQVRVINPENGQELEVTAKAYAIVYQGQGFTLVDPASYVPPAPPVMPPARNDHMAEELTGKSDTKPLAPAQTGRAPRGRKK